MALIEALASRLLDRVRILVIVLFVRALLRWMKVVHDSFIVVLRLKGHYLLVLRLIVALYLVNLVDEVCQLISSLVTCRLLMRIQLVLIILKSGLVISIGASTISV